MAGIYERARFEWNLVGFAVGIVLYFSVPFEPRLWILSAIFVVGLGLAVALQKRNAVSAPMLIVFLVFGLLWSTLHTQLIARPILPEYRKGYVVHGWVEKSAASGKLQQFYIRVHEIDDLATWRTPKRIRVRLKPQGFKPGDMIRIKAILNRPPIPAIADGYDPGRRAFFEQIGGYGFAISKPELIDLKSLTFAERLKRKLVESRYRMSAHIQARAPPKTAGLQAALLTGDRSAIPETQEQSLRDAGLAHLLAISGLHMGLLAGGAYFVGSLLFATIGPWARRYDMRKWAALVGALFATGYLLLSGASVSTQRAYIMALIVFAAIIFDRRAVSMRSVAVAAALVLVLHPESLLGAGFQMSFAATAALVAVYRYWADRRDFSNYQGPPGIFRRFWRGFTGLSVTSIVAGSATAGFAALHFHRFAKLGFIGNLAAMPVFTFLVMPAGFIAVLLIPLGMDGPFLKIMGLGLDYVLTVSDWVSARKGAVSYIKGANGTVTAVFGLGFVALCLGPKFVRVAGIAAIALAALMWANLSPPDMRISDQARIAYWQEDGDNILRVDSLRADGFGRRQFIEKSGVDGVELKPFEDTVAQCDHLACRIELKGKTVSVVSEPQGVMEACGDSDVVILTQRIAGPVARWKCDVTLVDADTFLEHGALDVSIDNGDVELKPANPPRRKARPWGR